MGEKKRLRLSLVDTKTTPLINSRKNFETSLSSEDLLTSSEHLFSAHDTIDLSPDNKQVEKDYVRITKQEYEEIKNRVSAIENRLSREFTDVEPVQQVQDVYEQTLEEVAMLQCPTSDHLARRLSKELKIRPTEQNKVIRSPSARKIGSIRRRSKENVTKIVRHKSWNASTLSQAVERFYPYAGSSRSRGADAKNKHSVGPSWNLSDSESSLNNSNSSQKYILRKRNSNACDYKVSTSGCPRNRRSLNVDVSRESRPGSSTSSAFDSGNKVESVGAANAAKLDARKSPSRSRQKWTSAAAFFMNKNGEIENGGQTGRPSVNKLRHQNAGAVLAKAKMFESGSDTSSTRDAERLDPAGFARKPRRAGVGNTKNSYKNIASSKGKIYVNCEPSRESSDTPPALPARTYKQNVRAQHGKDAADAWRSNRKATSPPPQGPHRTPAITPALKKPLLPQRNLRTPNCGAELRKANTPMRVPHTSPRRRSPRHKHNRGCTPAN